MVLLAAGAVTASAQGGAEAGGGIDVWGIALATVAGLVLFLYGVTRMADALRELAEIGPAQTRSSPVPVGAGKRFAPEFSICCSMWRR